MIDVTVRDVNRRMVATDVMGATSNHLWSQVAGIVSIRRLQTSSKVGGIRLVRVSTHSASRVNLRYSGAQLRAYC